MITWRQYLKTLSLIYLSLLAICWMTAVAFMGYPFVFALASLVKILVLPYTMSAVAGVVTLYLEQR